MTLFVHGWGFSPLIWSPLKGALYDRGYFGPPSAPKGRFKTIVVHSMGLHFLEAPEADHLIILSGFSQFTWQGRSLERMIQKITSNPREVLHDFYQNCGYNGASPWLEKDLHVARLHEDLLRLKTERFDLRRLAGCKRVTIVHGKEDRIAPLQQAKELHEALIGSQLHLIEGGHVATIDYCKELFKSGQEL